MNSVNLIGRLTENPEMRQTQSGTAVTNFSIAVPRDYKDQNGEYPTDFIQIQAWRHTAEFVCKYFVKGALCGRKRGGFCRRKKGQLRRTSSRSKL